MSRTAWSFATLLCIIAAVTISFITFQCLDYGQRRFQQCMDTGTQYTICTDPRTRGW